jgi:hypothetical protein
MQAAAGPPAGFAGQDEQPGLAGAGDHGPDLSDAEMAHAFWLELSLTYGLLPA